ncbi:MAG: succinylglutamate desuccinylase/aspartoacylase family protein [Butyrivibrio sp.]|uniref:M14 family metallopeptidase n=1 Tax=Butyrivibrio sp. TaxID=28121 RepID=UPI0025D5A5FD|nr:M14 family metallopeptidase [Butyrivibrio sp.]MCR5770520.1 succinylglutamate desuccinylase/aspartoacylase family protein [Butyrivibrio sp.]
MVEIVTSVDLPVDEKLMIRKNRIMPETFKSDGDMKRISLVTGIHGDELEGQYVCYELQRRINLKKDMLEGIVDIYPAMNPLGVDSITRGIPAFDLDMNRLFPGNIDGNMTEYIAAGIIDDVKGSDLVLDIHASNIFLTEIPQIRINELHAEKLVPIAKGANVDFIWVHGANTVLEATFAHSLNSIGTPVLVVEMGVGMRITKEYGNQLIDGIFNLMKEMGIWKGETPKVKKPMVSTDPDDIIYLNASASGLFIPLVVHGSNVSKGQIIGKIVDPLKGKVLDDVRSPGDGMIFTLRDYPIVDEGSLMGRILKKEVVTLEQ